MSDDLPHGVRIVERTDEGMVVELDEPCHESLAAEGADYVVTAYVPFAACWQTADGGVNWLQILCALYTTSLGTGAIGCTIGAVAYHRVVMGNVTSETLALGIHRRLSMHGPPFVPLGTVKWKLSELCVSPPPILIPRLARAPSRPPPP